MIRRGGVTRLLSGLVALIIAGSLCLSFPSKTINADGTILLSLSTQTQTVNPGDIININVNCDTFDSISEFGPVELIYDPSQFVFVSVTPATVLSGYEFTVNDSGSGSVEISADFVEVIDDETGLDVEPFDTDVQTMLFQLSLRAKSDASGDTSISIGSTGTFTRSDGADITSYSYEPITVNIAHGVSTDATLASLSIDRVTMTPAFDPQVFEYSASVSRDVTDIFVNAIPNNLQATVSIDGADNLSSGENIVSVHVLAQDGIRWREYRIFVNRQENYIPEGSGFIDSDGVTYTFMTFPSNLSIPEGFIQTTRTINGYSVPVFAKDGIASVLVYVYNGVEEPSLYFYNPVSGIATVYRPDDVVISVGRVLNNVDTPEEITVPRAFREGSIEIEGVEMSGYVNKYGDFISYFTDDAGNGSFYHYDPDTGKFYEYKSVDQSAEIVYRNLFYLFITLSVLQSIFIVIMVYVIRRVITSRTNPRPKRV
ncbi:MAG: cadherin-like beta sandwich domain-containing protein [Clostridiales bacterium]|nr:cadherin-like beta sandwich domain-containing protein [Clostridiales bacterium]